MTIDTFQINPFAFLRMRAGMTVRKFSETYNLSEQTIHGIESGTYPDLSDRMVVSLGHACAQRNLESAELLLENYGVMGLRLAYREWVHGRRAIGAERINAVKPRQWLAYSPMHTLAKDVAGSTKGFAKLLKVPPASFNRYGSGKQAFMPASVQEAFEEIGYPYLDSLTQMQREWRSRHAQL